MWRGHIIFFNGYGIIVFFVVAVLICALNTKQLQCQTALFGKKSDYEFNCVQSPELLWHNRNYRVKFHLHLCTLSLHICTVCVCMHIFCALSVTLSRHVKGRSYMDCPGPALFNVFTTTSMGSGRESILIKYCLSKLGRTAEFQRLRSQNTLDSLEEWEEIQKRKIHRGKRNQWCKHKMWKNWLNSSSAEEYLRLRLVTASP